MDIKFTFEDGGEYLAHYGKVGMRWRKGRKTPVRIVQSNKDGQTALGKAERARLESEEFKRSNSRASKVTGLKKALTKYLREKNVKKSLKRKNITAAHTSKAGLTAKYARKVASTNSNYNAIKERQRQQKLSGYTKTHG